MKPNLIFSPQLLPAIHKSLVVHISSRLSLIKAGSFQAFVF